MPRPNTGQAADQTRIAVRKAVIRLVPLLGLLYFVNYLDRVNIGFAGPSGMKADLGLTQTAFGLASGLFFLGYVLFEVPSNLALHRFGARRWIARIVLSWGVIATAMAFVPNETVLYGLRIALGVAEAGFFPGIILYLTYWIPQAQRARIVALFMAAVPISTALGATVSGLVIQYGDGVFGLAGWRFMFLVEGVPSLLLAVVTWCCLTDRPERAAWLTPGERTALADTLAAERDSMERAERWTMRRVFTHPRILGLALADTGIVYGLYALTFFLPTIIKGFEERYGVHYSIVQRGLINAVPYLIAAVAMVWWGRWSGRLGNPGLRVALPAFAGGLAIPVALYLGNPFAAMAAVTVCTVGVLCALSAFWALPGGFLAGAAAAGGIAFINSIANSGGFAAPYVTGWLGDRTGGHHLGMWVVGGCLIAAAAGILVLFRNYRTSSRIDC
ncbi:MFS transporter [Nocardia sp. 2]|uniref:MFS transporter n=1 Tax=Nocardia acididurans TaxID=2802282 RepID=A0ABS1M500_9NOCA|nr:MFS transporter [Nocardia acididurans]